MLQIIEVVIYHSTLLSSSDNRCSGQQVPSSTTFTCHQQLSWSTACQCSSSSPVPKSATASSLL